jgi:hypothetical protein
MGNSETKEKVINEEKNENNIINETKSNNLKFRNKIESYKKISKESKENENEDKDKEKEYIKTKEKIIFDTDIGTDIDDSLALQFLLHLPKEDYELLGITTTYG